jgi:DNA gyrase inhibitor GyrI
MSSCSIFGNSGVEIAPYEVLQSDGSIEIRHYEELLLVSTPMKGDLDKNEGAFNKLFRYISGENKAATKVEMTAPVLINPEDSEGQKIAMTAPVFMNQDENAENWTMSFVLPSTFDYETAPRPTDSDVTLDKITDLTVAAIRFNGLLRNDNTQKHKSQLERWIADNGFRITGSYKTAGYNPPWTLPNLRRNEVIIPVERQ